MQIVEVTPEMYAEFVASAPVALLHFRADWNKYDEAMQRRLSRLPDSLASDVRIGTIDTGQEAFAELIETLKIQSLPTLVYFRNGRHVDTSIGLSIREHIEGKLRSLLRN